MITVIRSCWRLLDRDLRLSAVSVLLLTLLSAVMEAVGIGMVLPLLYVLINPELIKTNPWLFKLYSLTGRPSDFQFMLILCGSLLGFFVVKSAFLALSTYWRNKFIWHGQATMSNRMLSGYIYAPYVYHLNVNSAVLIRNLIHSISVFFSNAIMPMLNIAAEALTVIAILLILYLSEPLITVFALFAIGIPTVFIVRLLNTPTKAWGQKSHDLYEESIRLLNQVFSTVREIKVFGREEYFRLGHERIVKSHAAITERHSLAQEMPRLILEVVGVALLIVVVLMVVGQNRPPADTIPILGAFAAAAMRLIPSANRISVQANAFGFGLAAVRKLEEDSNLGIAAPSLPCPARRLRLRDAIALENVSYRYPGADRNALEDIRLTIRRGESIALVGQSGGGKSTLAHVILGILVSQAGRLTVDGTDPAAGDSSWLLHASVIPQEIVLIDDTIRRNVAFGIADREIDPERMRTVLQAAQLTSFVSSLPNGLDTVIGERGVRLSGGQRQRLAIARALYDDPDVLIMDEATSALDADTEAAITDAIALLHGTKTFIVIAHRLSTVRNCDRMYWLESGRIVDSGTFDDIVARHDKFKNMAQRLGLSLNNESAEASS